MIIDFEYNLLGSEAILRDKMYDRIKSHDFGEAGYFYDLFKIVASNDLAWRMLDNNEALRTYVA